MQRLLNRRRPGREIVGREHAFVATPGNVHHLAIAAKLVNCFGNETLTPDSPCALNFFFAPAATQFRLFEKPLIGFGVFRVAEEAALLGQPATWQIDRGRCRPMDAEEIAYISDCRNRAFDQRMPISCIRDGRFQNIAQAQATKITQDHHVGLESARDASC